jgi:hypothetical protein
LTSGSLAIALKCARSTYSVASARDVHHAISGIHPDPSVRPWQPSACPGNPADQSGRETTANDHGHRGSHRPGRHPAEQPPVRKPHRTRRAASGLDHKSGPELKSHQPVGCGPGAAIAAVTASQFQNLLTACPSCCAGTPVRCRSRSCYACCPHSTRTWKLPSGLIASAVRPDVLLLSRRREMSLCGLEARDLA